jgi:hypothetical protein
MSLLLVMVLALAPVPGASAGASPSLRGYLPDRITLALESAPDTPLPQDAALCRAVAVVDAQGHVHQVGVDLGWGTCDPLRAGATRRAFESATFSPPRVAPDVEGPFLMESWVAWESGSPYGKLLVGGPTVRPARLREPLAFDKPRRLSGLSCVAVLDVSAAGVVDAQIGACAERLASELDRILDGLVMEPMLLQGQAVASEMLLRVYVSIDGTPTVSLRRRSEASGPSGARLRTQQLDASTWPVPVLAEPVGDAPVLCRVQAMVDVDGGVQVAHPSPLGPGTCPAHAQTAALDAVAWWRFDAPGEPASTIVLFRWDPGQTQAVWVQHPVIVAPKLLGVDRPSMPMEAKRRHYGTECVVVLEHDRDGVVERVRADDCEAPFAEVLDSKAMGGRVSPGSVDGVRVGGECQLRLAFELQ